jgi:putative hydrolase of the HAD superfamily
MTTLLIRRLRALSTPLSPRPAGPGSRLPALPGLRAVLFDVYGTLFVSASGDIGAGDEGSRAAAFRAALESCGLRPAPGRAAVLGSARLAKQIRAAHARARAAGTEHPEVDILAQLTTTLAGLHAEGLIRTRPGAARVRRFALEYEARQNPCWPMPGARETLAALRARGLALGIVSNAQFYTPLLFSALLGASPGRLGFRSRACIWSYRLLEAKPSRRLFRLAAAELKQRSGIEPAEILYVGNDMLNDIWPARACGFRTALFAGDARSLRLRHDDPRCRDLAPDALLTGLPQLVRLLD